MPPRTSTRNCGVATCGSRSRGSARKEPGSTRYLSPQSSRRKWNSCSSAPGSAAELTSRRRSRGAASQGIVYIPPQLVETAASSGRLRSRDLPPRDRGTLGAEALEEYHDVLKRRLGTGKPDRVEVAVKRPRFK